MIRHREARLQWARVHSRWTRQQWKNVLFTDEMRACLRHIDGRRRVWRRKGEQHSECCVQPVTAFGGGSVMVWGGHYPYQQDTSYLDKRKFEFQPICC